ncbi:MAG: diaminopimelate epimerase [Clostridia bacterium]|nr:diaminopimelate epimerase [Clostridia bacterium]
MRITKMHGIGNDYIYVNCFEETVNDPNRAAKDLSDRHFWVGSDGLVLIKPSEIADFEMDMYNSDGSQAEMCGNAIRCVGKYVYDNKMTDKTRITVATKAGIKILDLSVENGEVATVRVDMGEPILKPEEIPCLFEGENAIDRDIEVGGQNYKVTCVSMGNPHAVIYMDDIDNLEIEKIGPLFECHKMFPRKTNTEFLEIIDRENIKMRVWERGAGETWACGTGACAAAVASVLNGLVGRSVTMHLRGGDLKIEWDEATNHIFMTGSAKKVYDTDVDYV